MNTLADNAIKGAVTDFLPAGGEMGQLVRAFDWSRTSLGPMNTWPQSLRTTLSIILGSKFPMFLFWGPELIQFYNDAYRPSLGNDGKHPSALGGKATDTWQEIWKDIKPIIDQVLAGGEANWSEDQLLPIYRNGKMEDVYWTFSYSPVIDESGKPAGVFVTCTETTDKVINLKKSTDSKDQLLFAIDATELGTWDLNVATNKFSANDRLKEWFGLMADEEVPLTMAIDVMLESDRERVSAAIQGALDYNSGGRYDIEYTIINPITNKERIVRAKGRAWFNEDKVAYRFNGTLQDITEQAVAGRDIKNSEQNLRNVFQQAPVAMTLMRGPEHVLEVANHLTLKRYGKTEAEIIGKPIFEVLPETRGVFEDIVNGVYNTGIPYTSNNTRVPLLRNGKPEDVYVSFTYQPYREPDGTISGVMAVSIDVTDEINARKRLEESEKHWHQLANVVPAYIFTASPEGEITYVSDKWLEFAGVARDNEGVLDAYIQTIHPNDREGNGMKWQRAIEKQTVFENEVRWLHHDGQYRWIVLRAEPYRDSEGNIISWIGSGMDIAQLKTVQDALQESENRFRNMIHQAPVAMGILDGPDHVVEIANELMMELWGKTVNEVMYKPIFTGLPEAKGQGLEELLHSVYTTGVRFSASERPIDLPRNGIVQHLFINFVYEPLKKADGTVTGVLVVATDVTDQVLTRQKIEEAEAKARLAIESADLGTYEIDIATNYMQTSERFNVIWGLQDTTPRNEIVNYIHPHYRIIRMKAHEEALHTGNLEYEAMLVWKDGTEHWVRVKGKVLYNEHNEPTTILGVIQDITDQRKFSDQLFEQVKERTNELQRSNEDLLQFAHVTSHDLKEPVRKVKIFSSRLQDEFGDVLPERGKAYLGKVLAATDRMFAMIEGVLTFSAFNASEQPIDSVALDEVIENIASDLEIMMQQKNAVIHKDSLPQIEGATVLVYQLFYNLINNALKFARADVPAVITITSSVVIQAQISYAEIVVTDNGIGFEDEYAHKIFDTFARLNAKDKYEGTGLGLALCKRIVERHHGTISASGIKNVSATFTILLPLKQAKSII